MKFWNALKKWRIQNFGSPVIIEVNSEIHEKLQTSYIAGFSRDLSFNAVPIEADTEEPSSRKTFVYRGKILRSTLKHLRKEGVAVFEDPIVQTKYKTHGLAAANRQFNFVKQVIGLESSQFRGQGVRIVVFDGDNTHGGMSEFAVRQIAPEACIKLILADGGEDGMTRLSSVVSKMSKILLETDPPHVVNNSWALPQDLIPTKCSGHGDCPDIDKEDEVNNPGLYTCCSNHPYLKQVRTAILNNIILVFASGNYIYHELPQDCNKDGVYGANALSNVITVGAVNARSYRRSDSGYGKPSSLEAGKLVWKPDVCAYSKYGVFATNSEFNGTSSAAPLVAGTVALLLEASKGQATFKTIREALCSAAKQSDKSVGVHRDKTGFGLIQVDAAIDKIKELT